MREKRQESNTRNLSRERWPIRASSTLSGPRYPAAKVPMQGQCVAGSRVLLAAAQKAKENAPRLIIMPRSVQRVAYTPVLMRTEVVQIKFHAHSASPGHKHCCTGMAVASPAGNDAAEAFYSAFLGKNWQEKVSGTKPYLKFIPPAAYSVLFEL